MKRSLNIHFLSYTILALIIASTSKTLATTADGTLGATSTATIDVTFSIPEKFAISGMAGLSTALSFGVWTSGDFSGNADICIYSNGDGTYQITISDNSAADGFNIVNGGSNIAMTIRFNDTTTTSGNIATSDGTILTGQTNANASASDCTIGGNSANVEVLISGSAISAGSEGSYSSEITLFIEPA